MRMETSIHVFTLNCWGIIGISKNRKERIAAIAAHLAASDYDFVFLQEVWSIDDFLLICSKSEAALPYSHYFHSGAIGSGLGILSKSCILDAYLHRYSLNGYAHKIHHGDWFGGKAVGLCTTRHKGLSINLYVTHLHAEYNNHNDQYLGHRIVQAFEISQFVKLTSQSCDLTIIGGDFNTEPEDVAYALIKNNIACCDAFQEQSQEINPELGGTCCHPKNVYTSNKDKKIWPNGQRIDYIFFKSNKGTNVECLSCKTSLATIPGSDNIPYSDHQPVVAELHVSKSVTADGTPKSEAALSSAVTEAQCILAQSLTANYGDKFLYIIMSLLIFCLLLASLPFDLPMPYSILFTLLRILLAVALTFSFWMGIIVNKTEEKSLIGAISGITLLQKRLEMAQGNENGQHRSVS